MDLFLLAAAVIGGVVLAVVVARVILKAVSNGIDYLIETFGNERAAEEVRSRRERREKEGG